MVMTRNILIQVLHCRNYNDAAQLIRMVSEDAMNRSVTENICKEEAWLNRSWLTPDISKVKCACFTVWHKWKIDLQVFKPHNVQD